MKDKTVSFMRILVTLFLSTAVMVAFTAVAMATEKVPTLQNTDCIKCHKKEVATIEHNGGRHKTAVTCLDCHEEHPPLGKKTIPKCSKCHTGKSHYKLKGCLSCHSNPHEPLVLELSDNITTPCLTCHPKEGKDLQEYPSKHSKLACTFCHTKHGEIPECSRCHEPHVQGQTTKDCLVCHPPHSPLVIHYPNETPRSYCIPCHEDEGKLLDKTTTKHKTFTCAFCHRGVHGTIPQCETCHGQPHSAAITRAHPDCLDCHMDAHDLVK